MNQHQMQIHLMSMVRKYSPTKPCKLSYAEVRSDMLQTLHICGVLMSEVNKDFHKLMIEQAKRSEANDS